MEFGKKVIVQVQSIDLVDVKSNIVLMRGFFEFVMNVVNTVNPIGCRFQFFHNLAKNLVDKAFVTANGQHS